MAKGTEVYRDSTGREIRRETGMNEGAVGQANRQDAARASMGAKGTGGDDMPRQEPGESPAKYGARMRAYRERKARGGAVKEMLKR